MPQGRVGSSSRSLILGLPGAFLAVPLTLMAMIVFIQFEDTRWVAALLSNDGNPVFHKPRKGGPT